MSWNYRLCRYTVDGTVLFGIREVYYTDDGNISWTAAASVDDWETVHSVAGTVELMRSAIDQPIIDLDEGHIITIPSTCARLNVPESVCYLRFSDHANRGSAVTAFETPRGEQLLMDFDDGGKLIGIELLGPTKPCQHRKESVGG